MEFKSLETNQFYFLKLRKINKKPFKMPWKEAKISYHRGCIPPQSSRCHGNKLWMYNLTMKRNHS
jgi:hypothetical protein